MNRALLIAEKPSLMREIKAVYDRHRNEIPYECTFESQRGHLLTLMLPDELEPEMKQVSWDTLPFFPKEWKYKVIEETKQGNFQTAQERFDSIKSELQSGKYHFVINAADPDQEGELLCNMVLQEANSLNLPVARFWTNDLTEGAILNALQHLRNDRTDTQLVNLLKAGYIRQHSDYLFGMNISRGCTLQMGSTIAVGRVKTFIQNVVVQREETIRNFVPSTVYGIKANYIDGAVGTLFSDSEISDDENADEDQKNGVIWFDTKEQAENVIKTLPDTATVVSYQSKHSKTYSPKLFKLSSAQMVAGKHGMNPDVVLATIQSLYEKKLLSYPRTSCEYISSNENLEQIIKSIYVGEGLDEIRPFIKKINKEAIARVRKSKKWVNDKELKSKGHSAIIPTTTKPNLNIMTSNEKFIYMMIVKRFIAMFLDPWETDNITMITDAEGNTFKTTGKVTTNRGYLEIFDQNPSDTVIPKHEAGDILNIQNYEVAEKTSKCPSHLTEADIIAICENPIKYLSEDAERLLSLGKKLRIGTDATRSGIIKQLIIVNRYLYTEKSGKKEYVYPTQAGYDIIHNLNGLLITKADMTGEWEIKLEDVREGRADAEQVEQEIRNDMVIMLNEIKSRNDMKRVYKPKTDEKIIKCPWCSGTIATFNWGYVCRNHKKDDETSCRFILSKNIYGTNITENDLISLCKSGKTRVKTMTSKAGKKYKARVILNEDQTFGQEFDDGSTNMKCPKCGSPIKSFSRGYQCESDTCDFIVWNNVSGKQISDEQMRKLIKTGETDTIKGFKSKKENSAHKTFSTRLTFDENYHVVFKFK